MLRLYNITSFVDPETIQKLVDHAVRYHDDFGTETIVTTDHLGESGALTFLFTPNTEVTVAPFNGFHYRGDFEIGLTLDQGHRIEDLETLLTENGFQFESGFFGGNKINEYYLIPRKDGIFTPFFVISKNDTAKNRFLSAVNKIEFQIEVSRAATTEEFIRLVGLRKTLKIEGSSGAKNRVVAVCSSIVRDYPAPRSLRFDDVTMEFSGHQWAVGQE